ncbi:MAG: hypothetical protein QW104_05170 [Nitrososphaerota archaeon]
MGAVFLLGHGWMAAQHKESHYRSTASSLRTALPRELSPSQERDGERFTTYDSTKLPGTLRVAVERITSSTEIQADTPQSSEASVERAIRPSLLRTDKPEIHHD